MFRYRLQQFMYGRYGMDELNFALILLSLVVSVILMFFNNIFFIVRIVASAPLYYALFRTLSKNIEKRRSENDWFMRITSKFRKKGSYEAQKPYSQQNGTNYSSYGYDYTTKSAKKVKYKEDKKIYKYFKCPKCSTKLRVPKGKGKLTITCPKCHTQFKGKS